MSGRWTVFALTLGLGALPVLASAAQDHAVPRGGGSSGSSSSAGAHHSGSDGGAHSSSGGSSSGEHRSSGGHESSAPRNDAERRHPRPGTGTGDRLFGRSYYYYGSPYYYSRRYYYDAFDPFYYGYYGYSPFYYSGTYGYAPYYYRGRYNDSGSLRVIVDPPQTRVYVDGYYAGVVDEFDGHFQHMDLSPRPHRVEIRAPGYQPLVFDVVIQPHHKIDYRGTLLPSTP